MSSFLPYGQQWLDEADIDSVDKVLRGDWLTTGPHVDAFEDDLTTRTGAREAVAVNSGTSAIHAAYEAVGVDASTNVVVPSLTFSATANAARYLGAEIRFADVDETLTMDPASAAELVDDDTRLVAPVDYAGHPARLDELTELADQHDAALVEDAAHSLGSDFCGEPIGSVADITCFSFHPVKAITSGEGGAAVTDRPDWAERMREFRTHGVDYDDSPAGESEPAGGWTYELNELGYNYRITDIQCALGRSQLEKLDDFIDRRRDIADRYRERLNDFEPIVLPPEADWCRHAYHLFPIRVPAEHRQSIFESLRERNLGVQVHYVPTNMLGYYRNRGHDPDDTPRALRAYRRLISIPCFPKMDDDDVERVVETVREVVGQYAK